ncbi:glycosyltransferase family 2 protein [Parabacteroides bouchesdurhonensis]|uniref:glycosyltransferase family 2 protein n=1 Tax=Parabacteroides bouchesdurhonensis TaxID=1936995 RepID=UPI000E46E0D5|nr:glycosyltransferase family 2 protein [Parabacteroides bouchesdurhonensis]RHJ94904.1 glycosyltransferase [Bacteroides sp. AM07-16]
MRVSIITTTYNSGRTIRDTIESVLSQDYPDIEYIIIDGASTDDTLRIVNEYADRISLVISEPDEGIYDAMNKGIRMATGDVVGMLNSDDFFASSDIVSRIASEFTKSSLDAVYGDVRFVSPNDLSRCVRHYSSRVFRRPLMRLGFIPAHPSFYVRRMWYEHLGLYDTSYRICADFELLLRFIYVQRINIRYLPFDFVTMRTGGISTKGLRCHICIMKEHLRACRENKVYTNPLLLSFRYLYKLTEFICVY